MDLLFASSNKHKFSEFKDIFSGSNIELALPQRSIEVVEDGETFRENAFKKAISYHQEFKSAVLSDDSGLIVESLPGQLGVRTARYGGEGLSDRQRCETLLRALDQVQDRSAYFVCYLCFYLGAGEIFYFEGRLNGRIDVQLRGEDGFGYDPIFIPDKGGDESTLSMVSEWKRENSHRALACKAAMEFFSKRNCQSSLNHL